MTNFNIVEGEEEDFWDKYLEFVEEYNNPDILAKSIPKKLGITQCKYRQYFARAVEEKLIDPEMRSPANTKKRPYAKTILNEIKEKQGKVYKYVEATWFEIHCKDKNEVKKIIAREILDHPEMDYDKLCLHCKRICMAEL